MKHLSAALQKSIGQQTQMQERLLVTIEALTRLTQSQAQKQNPTQINKNHRITPPLQMSGVISALDMLSGACKVSLIHDPVSGDPSMGVLKSRIAAKIVDPLVGLPNNPYARALSEVSSITFTAKAEIGANGNVITLYISDCQRQPTASD